MEVEPLDECGPQVGVAWITSVQGRGGYDLKHFETGLTHLETTAHYAPIEIHCGKYAPQPGSHLAQLNSWMNISADLGDVDAYLKRWNAVAEAACRGYLHEKLGVNA